MSALYETLQAYFNIYKATKNSGSHFSCDLRISGILRFMLGPAYRNSLNKCISFMVCVRTFIYMCKGSEGVRQNENTPRLSV